jgi:hypothetical protein
MNIWRSNHRTVNEGFAKFAKFGLDDSLHCGKSIERYLREQVVFSLELHSSHKQQPEQIFFVVVAACLDLMVDEGHVRLLRESLLPLVVADQHIGGVEPSDELCDDEVDNAVGEQVEGCVVDENEGGVDLSRKTDT